MSSANGGAFALRLHLTPKAQDRIFIVASLLDARNGVDGFSAAEIQDAFVRLTIPPPGAISTVLGRLGKADLLIPKKPGRWRLTPIGRQKAVEIAGGVDPAVLEHESASVPAAEFDHVAHTVIPPWAAPPRWQVGIRRMLEQYPFESNVFCMTRFPSEGGEPDPVHDAVEALREVFTAHGLMLHLASDRQNEDDVLGNIGAFMWACQYGIGIVEDRVGRGLNYNAVIELGAMMMTGRRCAILMDSTVGALPTDLSGQIYKSVNLDEPTTVVAQAKAWIKDDLGL